MHSRGKSGQLVICIQSWIILALLAGGSLSGGRCPPTGPPILCFLPLTAGDNREEVNEEDFDDFDDTDDRTAHPQAELSTEVGQKHLNLQGRLCYNFKMDFPRLRVVAHAGNPTVREQGQKDDCQFKVSLGYLVRQSGRGEGEGFSQLVSATGLSPFTQRGFLSEALLASGSKTTSGQILTH